VSPHPNTPVFFASPAGRRLFWLCGLLLLVVAFAANMRVLDFGFLYLRDDDVNVTLNPHMGGLDAARLKWMFTDWSYVRRYIPLGWLNFSATYQFAGLDPLFYHAVALILYLLNVALVLALLVHALRLFGPGRRDLGLSSWDVGSAALATGWWALHPFRVETTAWVSGNLYGQSMALLFASLLAYFRTYLTQGGHRASWLCLAAVGYTASLLTYPLALGVPFLLIGLDWLRSRDGTPPRFRRLLAEKAAFFIPLAGVLAITVAARFGNTEVFGAVPGIREFPVLSRAAQSAYVATYYVWKPWWPTHLSPLYDTLMDFNPLGAPFVLSMAAVAAACVLSLLCFRRRPVVAVLWFGYLACAAPFFGLTEKPHMASDRYGYLLTVIMAGVLAAALAAISARGARALAMCASVAVIAALGRLSWRQLEVWSDDRLQHAYVAAHLTNQELLDDFNSRQQILEFLRGNEKAAEDAVSARLARNPEGQGFRRAAAIIADKKRISAFYGPVSFLAILQDQMAVAFAKAGELREANDHFEDALRLDDRFYQAAYDRSLLLLRMGRGDDALSSYLRAVRWASRPLPPLQRRAFLEGLQSEAGLEGNALLAAAARNALAR
jgi:tetratricopeptide (TPR) repeat protein